MKKLRAMVKSGSDVRELRRVKIEVHGQDAVQAAEELLSIEEFKDSNYEIVNEVEQEGTLATIATIVGIWGGSLTIAEKLYQWNQKYQKSLPRLVGAQI